MEKALLAERRESRLRKDYQADGEHRRHTKMAAYNRHDKHRNYSI